MNQTDNELVSAVGDPIHAGSGNMLQTEVDYVGAGAFPLTFVRMYNSHLNQGALDLMDGQNYTFGTNWTYLYSSAHNVSVGTTNLGTIALVSRPDSKKVSFTLTNGQWVGETDVPDTLTQLLDSNQQPAGWVYHNGVTDLTETYDVNGVLQSIVNRTGLAHTLTHDARGRVISVADSFGRVITLAYGTGGITGNERVVTMTDPAGGVYSYGYTNGLLTSVTHPDGSTRQYVYNEASQGAGGQIALLTGIVDANGQRFASFGYDVSGHAISSQHAGGAEKVTLSSFNGATHVTDTQGVVRTYGFSTLQAAPKLSSVTGPPCSACNGLAAITYDANGFTASTTDFRGIQTTYVNDSLGRELSRTEAVGTTEQRTITTTWHSTFRLPLQIVEPGRTTTNTYDAQGNLTQKTIAAGSQSRTVSYTYDSQGHVLRVDGARTDVNDVTVNTYDAQGNLLTSTNPLGQVTTYGPYNALGLPLAVTDANGLVARYTYNPVGRMLTKTVGSEVTAYTYDAIGQLTQITYPDGSAAGNSYDAAHRVVGKADNLGDSVVYTLDAAGNRLREDTYNPAAQLTQTVSSVYDTLNHLVRSIGASGQTTQYTYDNNGNLTQVTDPLNRTTSYTYDALNRKIITVDPLGRSTTIAYNALNQVVSITDARGLTTYYTVDGLGNTTQVQSPDTGISTATFDAAGNALTRTDAKGQTTTYTYDALNRVTNKSYSTDPTLNVSYTYDQGTFGIGHLTGLLDNAGTTAYAYDIHGRLTSETRTMGGVAYVTSYVYDAAGRLASTTYPSGRQVSYGYDPMGRVNGIVTTRNNVSQTLLTGVTYRPFGPEQVLTFGNSQTYTRSFDQDGRMTGYTLPNQSLTLSYDLASQISLISDTANPSNTISLSYDALSRLTGFTAPGVSDAFTYDAVGNRLTNRIGASTYTASYGATSNQIATVSGPTPQTFGFDANGSIVGDAFRSFSYDARGRMNQLVGTGGTTLYVVNSLGRRVKKTVAGVDTVFHYDSGGKLIAESDSQGNVQVEYVYVNDIPLAVFK